MSDEEKDLGQSELEAPSAETKALEMSSQQQTDDELFRAALDGEISMGEGFEEFMFAPIKRGQIIKGTVAGKSESEILVDIGVKSEGLITGRELDDLDSETKGALRIGDEIMVYVLSSESSGGHVYLSLKRALEEQDWVDAEDYMKEVKLYESKVTGFNKGGLIVKFGKLRGFVPASQISRERQMRSSGETPDQRWSKMVGEDIAVKVIEVDRGRNRLILSERAAAKEVRTQRRQDLLTTLAVGQVHTGHVISLADFGAFVDLGGADGLIHLSELSWEHVTNPKEVLNVGDEVKVEIINIDPERQRIGLSRKKVLEDPWVSVANQYKPGQLVQGTITKMTKFGAFARLVDRPEIEGLIHISELSDRRIAHPREAVEENQIVTLRVIRVDSERRRLALSLKQAMSEEFAETDWHAVLETLDDEDEEPKPTSEAAPEPPAAKEESPAAEVEVAEEPAAEEPAAEEPAASAEPVEESAAAEPDTSDVASTEDA
jgi:small subunit ribosomal protein S1